MKKYLAILILAVTFSSCNSQSTIIKGLAICFGGSPEFSQNVPVYLRLSDTSYLVARTNASGEYLFKVNKNTGTVIICIEAIRLNESGGKENYGYRTCSQTKTLTLNGDTVKVENFFLNPRTAIDYAPQPVLFKFNSLITVKEKNLVPFTDLPADSAISAIITLLNSNPTIVLQISGHCDSREINPKKLSQDRAEYVVNLLIKKGIPKERLVAKGFGIDRLLIRSEEINQAKQSDKERLHQRNRRVIFGILNFDYKK